MTMTVRTNDMYSFKPSSSKSAPCSPIKAQQQTTALPSEPFHIAHKIPIGDTPYVIAKRVQLVDKNPNEAIALFWAAINAGDRIDSALKDMAIVMKQQNRPEEAIEAIKSLRNLCSDQAQESLDNILLDLYKRCGRLDDQIALLRHKLKLIQLGLAFNGRRTKTARSQGRKFQVSVDQEATRLLGNLGWALMQQQNYLEAEAAYRRALLIGPDNNKMCNLGICLMKQGRVGEAKATLKQVKPALADGPRGVDSHLKAFERAQEMLRDIESKRTTTTETNGVEWRSAFLDSVWQPHPCTDLTRSFGDENVKPPPPQPCSDLGHNQMGNNALNIHAPPFYLKPAHQAQDPLGNLKRTRSGNLGADKKPPLPPKQQKLEPLEDAKIIRRRRSLPSDQVDEEVSNKWIDLLPDSKAFEEAMMAAALLPILETDHIENEKRQRLRVFNDITHITHIQRKTIT